MSLTKRQKGELNEFSSYLKEIKGNAVENFIDLDVFMCNYNEDGFAFYSTESVDIKSKAEKRKKVFEKSSKRQTPTKIKTKA
jgi:hypothetical protein